MLIYLGDLAYFHSWDNIQPIPLNVGYVAAYLKEKHPEIEIEIFKEPRKLMDRVSEKSPDILGLSHYEWNSNLDLAILKHVKQIDSNVESTQKKKYLDDIIKDSFLKDYFSIFNIKILK